MLILVIGDTILVLLLGVLVAGLLRSHADILRALRDLGAPVGDPASADDHESGGDRTAGAPAAWSATARTPQRRGGAFRISADLRAGAEPAGPQPAGAEPAGPGRASPAPAGGEATDLSGQTPEGDAVAVAVTSVPHATLLVFLSSGCSICGPMWRAVSDARSVGLPSGVRPVVVAKGPEAEQPSAVRRLAPIGDIPVIMSTEAWQDYAVPGSPFFVLVDGPTGRRLGEGTASSFQQVVGLVRRARSEQGFGAAGSDGRAGPAGAAPRDTDAAMNAAGLLPGDARLHHRDLNDVMAPRRSE